MGTTANYILNGPTLATSSTATIPPPSGGTAPDGYYSDGTIVRQLLGGVFVDSQDCDCTTACANNPITRPVGVQSTDYIDISTGPNAGVVIVKFNPSSAPVGITSAMGNTGYNTWSSPADGEHTRIATGPFFLGDLSSGFSPVGSWPGVEERDYYNGVFTITGSEVNYVFTSNNVSLTAGASAGTLVQVIPKPISGQSIVTLGVTCLTTTSTSYQVSVECAAPIPDTNRFLISQVYATPPACGATPILPDSVYLVSVQSTPLTTPTRFDYLFSDNTGTSYPADGSYLMNSTTTTPVVQYVITLSNGIITNNVTACP